MPCGTIIKKLKECIFVILAIIGVVVGLKLLLAPRTINISTNAPQTSQDFYVGLPVAQARAAPIPGAPTSTWDGYALLKRITSCESWGDPDKEPREFLPDGSVLRGYPNPNDIGLGQINLPTWGSTAKKLGFDLYTYGGNLGFSKWLFDHYGSKPWKYSKPCWNA